MNYLKMTADKKAVIKKALPHFIAAIAILVMLMICILSASRAWFSKNEIVRARGVHIGLYKFFGVEFKLYMSVWDEDTENWVWVEVPPIEDALEFAGITFIEDAYDFTAKIGMEDEAYEDRSILPNETRRFKLTSTEQFNTVEFYGINFYMDEPLKERGDINIADYYYFAAEPEDFLPDTGTPEVFGFLNMRTQDLVDYKMSEHMRTEGRILLEMDAAYNDTDSRYEFIFDIYVDSAVDNFFAFSGFYSYIRAMLVDEE